MAALTQEDWLHRYRKRFMDRTDMGYAEATQMCHLAPFADISEFYEDDPEGAADNEMSNWTD